MSGAGKLGPPGPHERFMRRALTLARKGLGRTSPNPAVGAVIERGGRVIGEGYHRKAGLPHAEIEAMRDAGWKGVGKAGARGARGTEGVSGVGGVKGMDKSLNGATLYVTLEPCPHYGRTPPCTDAIIGSGIKRVVIGANDPNPRVRGAGIRKLRAAGIEVISGVLANECSGLNASYNKYIRTKRPYVTVKVASSLDGRIATSIGESRWITGAASRREVHKIRSKVDAVMVGVNTVLKDDPSLTARAPGAVRNPLRAVVDSAFRIPLSANVFKNLGRDSLVIFTTGRAPESKIRRAASLGATVIKVKNGRGGERGGRGVDLPDVLNKLGRLGVTHLLVEGGGSLAASFIREGLVDRLLLFVSPLIIGGDGVPSIGGLGIKRLKEAVRLKDMTIRRVGEDFLFEALL